MNKLSFVLFISLLNCQAFGAIDFVKKVLGLTFDKGELLEIIYRDDLEAFEKLHARFPNMINIKLGPDKIPVFSEASKCVKKEISEFILNCKNFDANACDIDGTCTLSCVNLDCFWGINIFTKLCMLPGIKPDIADDHNSTTLNYIALSADHCARNLKAKSYMWANSPSKEQMEDSLRFRLMAVELLLKIGADPYHKSNFYGRPIDCVPEIQEISQKIKLEYKPEMQDQLREIANIPEEISEIVLDYFI